MSVFKVDPTLVAHLLVVAGLRRVTYPTPESEEFSSAYGFSHVIAEDAKGHLLAMEFLPGYGKSLEDWLKALEPLTPEFVTFDFPVLSQDFAVRLSSPDATAVIVAMRAIESMAEDEL